MKIQKRLFYLFKIYTLACLLAACQSAASPTARPTSKIPTTEIPATEIAATKTPNAMETLVAAAQTEGTLNTIGLSHNWCNYGEMIEAFKSKYGLEVNELNPTAGFADEIQAISANQDSNSQVPDVIDVDLNFGSSSKAENLIQPYKVSTWNTIPENVKDPDGYWYGDYYWVSAFLVNTDVQPDIPKDWASLLDPKYNGQVALSGDPRTSNQAIQSVYAAALANGGSLDDATPGLSYFAKLNRTGNLVPLISTNKLVAMGETPVRITWDYYALSTADSFAGHPKVEVVIPDNGRLAAIYVQAINAHAPHPNAAKLWMEWLYSDEGQLLWMKGHCHPIRESDLRARGIIPQDLLAKLPDATGAVFPTLDQLNTAKDLITTQWDKIVGVNIRVAP